MSTVDKGPSSRSSNAVDDAPDAAASTARPSASSATNSTKSSSSTQQTAPAPQPSRQQPTSKRDGKQATGSTSTAPSKPASGSSNGKQATKKSPQNQSGAEAGNARSAPLDPGLALSSSTKSTRRKGKGRRRSNSDDQAAPETTVIPVPPDVDEYSDDFDDLPPTGEQLVITPVSDVVGPAPERAKKRPAQAAPEADMAETTAVLAPVGGASAGDHRTVPLPSTVARPTSRGAHRRARVRRVTRVVRHIDPWSAFKAGLLFSLVGYVVCLTSGVLLWRVAEQTGTIDNVQGWFTQFGWETFELDGGEIYHNAWILGLFLAVGFTGLIVLGVTLFNLVSDIIGGIRVSVLEEEVVERRVMTSRRYAVRRPGVGAADPTATNWSVDTISPQASPTQAAALPATTTNWSVDD